MVKPVWLSAALLSAVCFLSGCGGGGSGDAPRGSAPVTGSPPVAGGATDGGGANSWLTFSPASVSQTVKERSFVLPISIVATSSKTIAERVNVAIVDTVGVLDAKATSVTALSTTSYQARLSLLPTLKPGTYRGSFKVQICLDDPQVCQRPYPGSPWLIPFDIEVKPWAQTRAVHKLLVSETGVALTGMPNFSRLTRSISVSDNLGQATRWQAQSDQPWLTVTQSGAAGDVLQIQADPSSLAANSISYATVSVTSPDAAVAAAQPVVVALWKGAGPAHQLASTSTVMSRYQSLLADPIRPHVYANSGGGTIDVYNIYTGALVGTMSAAGASFGKMLASPDGAFLYAVDSTGSQLKVFDVRAGQLVASWPFDVPMTVFDSYYVDLVYARPNGVGVVVLTTGQIFRASDGKVLASKVDQAPDRFTFSPELQSSYITASPDGTRIYSTDSRKHTPNTPFYWDIDYSEAAAGTLSLTRPFAVNLSQARLPVAGGIAMSRDGKRVLMLSYNDGISLWNPEDLSRAGMLTRGLTFDAGTLIVTADGRIVVAGMETSGTQFHILSPEGDLLKTLSTMLPASTIKPNDTGSIRTWTLGMAVSADGAVAIQSAYHQVGRDLEYLLTFTPIAP
jgi:WD40 repeat protein